MILRHETSDQTKGANKLMAKGWAELPSPMSFDLSPPEILWPRGIVPALALEGQVTIFPLVHREQFPMDDRSIGISLQ
jgi:hypothetical protein